MRNLDIKKAQEEKNSINKNYEGEYIGKRIIYLKQGVTNKQLISKLSEVEDLGVSIISRRKQANRLIINLAAAQRSDLTMADRILFQIADQYEAQGEYVPF